MKLISYAHTNSDAWALAKKGQKTEHPGESSAAEVRYPANLTLPNIAYFMLAPTLCYQMSYPRNKVVRKGWVLRQALKLLTFMGLMGFMIEQSLALPISVSRSGHKYHPVPPKDLVQPKRVSPSLVHINSHKL